MRRRCVCRGHLRPCSSAGSPIQGKWEPLAKAQLKKVKDRHKDEKRKEKAAAEREVRQFRLDDGLV